MFHAVWYNKTKIYIFQSPLVDEADADAEVAEDVESIVEEPETSAVHNEEEADDEEDEEEKKQEEVGDGEQDEVPETEESEDGEKEERETSAVVDEEGAIEEDDEEAGEDLMDASRLKSSPLQRVRVYLIYFCIC